QLGTYITVIAESRVFDTETKRAIPQEDLTKVEVVPGALSQQQRVSWVYSNVYEIVGEETQDAIAVEINDQYLRAEHLQ
ncbi:MAG: NisI/SpaI family lantibiotic immunity lipoprotein, partial [Pygmaiobacter sp.]|nr:NisI/SpaI family lantibiotic immunity lipoprotein [Pygmaiobacter sp.]